MPAKTLYFDESGYTGYNLLEPEQPTFAIASTDFGPGTAGAILRESFPGYQGYEFKFSNIWRGRNRRALIDLSRRRIGICHFGQPTRSGVCSGPSWKSSARWRQLSRKVGGTGRAARHVGEFRLSDADIRAIVTLIRDNDATMRMNASELLMKITDPEAVTTGIEQLKTIIDHRDRDDARPNRQTDRRIARAQGEPMTAR